MCFYKDIYQTNKNSSVEINKILKEIINNEQINFFIYRRFYKDGSLVYLCNHEEWLAFRFNINYWASNTLYEETNLFLEKNQKIFLWNMNYAKKDKIYQYLYEKDIYNGINFYSHHENYIEIFGFASSTSNYINNFFMNNLEKFNFFIFYFKNQMKDTIKYLKKYGIITTPFTFEKKNLLKKTPENKPILNKLYIDDNTYVTKKEIDCLLLLKNGMSNKEIAHKLSQNKETSVRTIEGHINNLKKKFDVYSRSHLIQEVNKLNRKISLDYLNNQ